MAPHTGQAQPPCMHASACAGPHLQSLPSSEAAHGRACGPACSRLLRLAQGFCWNAASEQGSPGSRAHQGEADGADDRVHARRVPPQAARRAWPAAGLQRLLVLGCEHVPHLRMRPPAPLLDMQQPYTSAHTAGQPSCRRLDMPQHGWRGGAMWVTAPCRSMPCRARLCSDHAGWGSSCQGVQP